VRVPLSALSRGVAVLATLAALLVVVAPASPASAAGVQIGISDDGILLFDQDEAPAAVQAWKAAGIDTVRIQVRWIAVLRDQVSTAPPIGFDATNPDDPGYDWTYLDNAIGLVTDAGLTPLLSLTGSGPIWASRAPALGNPRYEPDPAQFGQFATAVARRYGAVTDQYIIWNEPNQPLWLQPQQECVGRRCTPVAPHLYRELVRAAYPAIHGNDADAEVIAGALAPRGADPTSRNRPVRPLAFIRAFGCVDARFKKVRTGRCQGFRPVRIDGFAYHPHPVKASPSTPAPQRDDATIADLGKLEDTLDGVQRAGGFTTPTGAHVALHLTEFSYQTNPPDKADGIPSARASRWLQEAGYRAWRDPRVRTLVQYVWQDEPVRNLGGGRKRYSGWQSGLLNVDGQPKATLGGFEHPFFADPTVARPKVRFWGQVRPGTVHAVALQKRSPSGSYVTVKALRTDGRGNFAVTLALKATGKYRFRTTDPVPAPRYTSDVLTVTPAKKAKPAATRG
jgi:hypothetical protein